MTGAVVEVNRYAIRLTIEVNGSFAGTNAIWRELSQEDFVQIGPMNGEIIDPKALTYNSAIGAGNFVPLLVENGKGIKLAASVYNLIGNPQSLKRFDGICRQRQTST